MKVLNLVRQAYLAILRGHYFRLVKRGRPSADALSDSCYLTTMSAWMYLVAILLLLDIKLPKNQFLYVGLGLLVLGVLYLAHKWLVDRWRADLVRASAVKTIGGKKISENVLSWIHFIASMILFAVATATTTSFD